ncbi:hypothetical protein [Natrinema sp. H-ect4]|uniref:hypothetical protein n=1 Tax=Natrinema sp. H-ect4 TaxID=3242699 RepID=UPI0035A861EF
MGGERWDEAEEGADVVARFPRETERATGRSDALCRIDVKSACAGIQTKDLVK